VSKLSKVDLEFCWDQVLEFDPWFRLHFAFAPKRNATQILALHALFAMIERGLRLSEESLVITQLAWWHNELSPAQSASSRHPVVRLLRESGALSCFAEDQLEGFMAPTPQRLRAEPLQKEEDLKALCGRIGKGRAQLELALDTGGQGLRELQAHCAGTGLISLCAMALRDRQPSFWFMPLNIQARHQVQHHEIDSHTAGGTAALAELRSLGEEWFEDQNRELALAVSQRGSAPSVHRHLLAMGLTQRLEFTRAMGRREAGQTKTSRTWGLQDLIRIWSKYRALLRAADRKH